MPPPLRPRAKKRLLVAAGLYAALWGATYLAGPRLLERQLLAEARRDWERYRGDPKAPRYGSMAHRNGPSVSVTLLACPAPFIIKAECGRVIGPLNGYGTVAYYFLTPWQAYALVEKADWVASNRETRPPRRHTLAAR